jgi:hypothetical protein
MRLIMVCVPSATRTLMARSLRSPGALMTVYVAVFICGGPWIGSASAAGRNVPQIAIAVLLAVLAARGSRPARVLMITYTVLGAFAVFYGTTYWGASEPFAASSLTLTCALVQIGLLVSVPMYQRTRPDWSLGAFQSEQFLPWPKLWAVLASAAGGIGLALLPFSDGAGPSVRRVAPGRRRTAMRLGSATRSRTGLPTTIWRRGASSSQLSRRTWRCGASVSC